MGKNRIRELVLKNPDFMKIQVANLISRFGDSIDAIAFAWLVFDLTGSTLLIGAIFAVNALPNIIFAAFSGVFADHFKKQRTIVLCHVGRGILVSTGGLLFIFGHLDVWMLFVLTFLNSTLETFAAPAHGALAVHLVEKDQLVEAEGLASSLSTLAQMLGLAAAGIIIAWFGVGGAIIIDGLTFFLAAGLTALAKIQGDSGKAEKMNLGTWWTNLKEGMVVIKASRPLMVAMFLAMFVNFAFSPLNVLEAAYVKDVLHAGPDALSYIGLALMLGMIVGGLLAGGATRKWGTWPVVFAGFIGIGGAYVLVALPGFLPPGISPLVVALGAYFLTGAILPFINSPLIGWLCATVEPKVQGRVFAVLNAFCLMASPLGAAMSGALAQMVPMVWLFVVLGILVVLVSLCLRIILGKSAGMDPSVLLSAPAVDEASSS